MINQGKIFRKQCLTISMPDSHSPIIESQNKSKFIRETYFGPMLITIQLSWPSWPCSLLISELSSCSTAVETPGMQTTSGCLGWGVCAYLKIPLAVIEIKNWIAVQNGFIWAFSLLEVCIPDLTFLLLLPVCLYLCHTLDSVLTDIWSLVLIFQIFTSVSLSITLTDLLSLSSLCYGPLWCERCLQKTNMISYVLRAKILHVMFFNDKQNLI